MHFSKSFTGLIVSLLYFYTIAPFYLIMDDINRGIG